MQLPLSWPQCTLTHSYAKDMLKCRNQTCDGRQPQIASVEPMDCMRSDPMAWNRQWSSSGVVTASTGCYYVAPSTHTRYDYWKRTKRW